MKVFTLEKSTGGIVAIFQFRKDAIEAAKRRIVSRIRECNEEFDMTDEEVWNEYEGDINIDEGIDEVDAYTIDYEDTEPTYIVDCWVLQ